LSKTKRERLSFFSHLFLLFECFLMRFSSWRDFNIIFFLHRNFFSFIRSQDFWDEQFFIFFYFFLQNAFYKLVMFNKFFKHFKLRSNCRKNDVDIDIKFVIN
jgi:hypothetical protein